MRTPDLQLIYIHISWNKAQYEIKIAQLNLCASVANKNNICTEEKREDLIIFYYGEIEIMQLIEKLHIHVYCKDRFQLQWYRKEN